jgi:hypothetical protein
MASIRPWISGKFTKQNKGFSLAGDALGAAIK